MECPANTSAKTFWKNRASLPPFSIKNHDVGTPLFPRFNRLDVGITGIFEGDDGNVSVRRLYEIGGHVPMTFDMSSENLTLGHSV